MKPHILLLLVSLIWMPRAWALPQDFGDLGDIALFGGGLTLDGRDLTQGFLADAVWASEAELPGHWREGEAVGSRRTRIMTAAPYLFGQVPIGVEAVYEANDLERVSIYYLESGTFYGYSPELKNSADGKKTLRDKQRLFRRVFDRLVKDLGEVVADVTDDRGESLVAGKTPVFKHRYRQYESGDLALQLRAKKDFFVRLDLRRLEDANRGFLLPELERVRKKDRAHALKQNVVQSDAGDVEVSGIPMIYQGGRAYCGITTYLMAAQYLGVDMDPATMASESGFRYGMGGKKMIEAYNAVAREGDLRLSRTTKLDVDRVKASIDAGIPVMVWRRFDIERNRLHTGWRRGRGERVFALPEPDANDQAKWPGAGAPAHASVITGYNPERNEFIFSESWGEHASGKRIREEELAATAYYAFYFSL